MDYLDEALLRLAATGPQYRGGLSNHGPMVAEALIRLGSEDAVPSWVSTYLAGLRGPARRGTSGSPTGAQALGDVAGSATGLAISRTDWRTRRGARWSSNGGPG